jgi:hypothetical protein
MPQYASAASFSGHAKLVKVRAKHRTVLDGQNTLGLQRRIPPGHQFENSPQLLPWTHSCWVVDQPHLHCRSIIHALDKRRIHATTRLLFKGRHKLIQAVVKELQSLKSPAAEGFVDANALHFNGACQFHFEPFSAASKDG